MTFLWLYNLFHRPKLVRCQYCGAAQELASGWDKQMCIGCGKKMYFFS
jgi:hypothetical protein